MGWPGPDSSGPGWAFGACLARVSSLTEDREGHGCDSPAAGRARREEGGLLYVVEE